MTTGPGAATDAHLLLAFEGPVAPAALLARLRDRPPAGVTLFTSNIVGAAETRRLTATLQSARPAGTPPLLIAADQEGGQFLALGQDTTPFAGNLALGAVGDVDLAERVGAAMGREARALGVNVDYAPDCDLIVDPAAAAVGIRSFGDDPVAAGDLAAAVVRGLHSSGVAAAPKHFPGTGALAVDSHHALGSVDAPRAVLDRRELVAFRAALDAGPGLVMTGHVAVPALTGRDDLPATLSPAVVTDLLRGELGYRGVVVTDALDMGALTQGSGRVIDAIAALRAGVDLLLCVPDGSAIDQLTDGLALAASRGLLDHDGLAASATRIATLRGSLAEHPQPPVDVVGGDEHRRLAAELARRSITLVRDEAGLLPLRRADVGRVLVLQPRPRDVTPADTTGRVPPLLATALRHHLDEVDEVVYDDPPRPAEVAAVLERVERADLVVLGTSNAHQVPEQLALADAVLASGRRTVVVVLRSPFDAAALPAAPSVLCTYGILPPTMEAVAAVLVGAQYAPGQLPVDLGLLGGAHGREHHAR